MKQLNHNMFEKREKKGKFLVKVATCNYVKKKYRDGIKQFSHLSAVFYAFLWAILVYCLKCLATKALILQQKGNQLPQMCFINIYFLSHNFPLRVVVTDVDFLDSILRLAHVLRNKRGVFK